jgi:hypothetical protein
VGHIANPRVWMPHVLVFALATMAFAILGGWRKAHQGIVLSLSVLGGLWVTTVPFVLQLIAHEVWGETRIGLLALAILALAVPLAVLGFGTFLMVLTLLGIEHNHAYSSLAHPGYKHFVRLRVRKDGSAVDGWAIGKIDTLDSDAEIVLVDRWTWNNPAHVDTGRVDREET